jgi:Ca-activated chloride channel family protein
MKVVLTVIASSLLAWSMLAMPAACPAAAAAQQEQTAPVERPPLADQTPDTLHVERRLVSVALNVVDQHGAPVPGLKADDFELAEDGNSQHIDFFDTESTTPLEIVLAIDASESVFTDDRLERDAAKSFVKSLLRSQDRLDLISFSDDVAEVVAFTNDAKAIESGLGRLQHGDATALYDAVYLASQRLAEVPSKAGARRVVVLITDGENTTRHGSYDAAIEEA